MEIFGFQINLKRKQETPNSVVVPTAEDGSVVLSSSAAAYYSQVVDMDASIRNENDLIKRYRDISLYPECDSAVEEIVNEAICISEGEVAKLNLEELKVGESVKKKIQLEFEEIKFKLDFDVKAHDLFRSWYIDGRQYLIVTLNPDRPKDGILKIEQVDSRKIRKVKKIDKQKDPKTGVDLIKSVEEFFMYNERGIDSSATTGVKLSVDSVVYTPSGLYDSNANLMLGYLHKAVKTVNQLKMLEDAVVIYRIARAPERRIFYIDVGNLPKVKAEQYITDIMNKYKNKIVYDATTGDIKDDRRHQSMLEDFWLPRREGGKGTEISTLPSGQSLGQMDDVNYFQQKLYQSLNVPISRLLPQQNFSLGRSNEITRDELKFNKFVQRLRNRFSQMLVDLLRIQLIAKNIVSADDWQELEKNIFVDFANDNNFAEIKETELWQNRFLMLQQIDPYVGKYFSPEWVKKSILRFTEEEIEQMDKEVEEFKKQAAAEMQAHVDLGVSPDQAAQVAGSGATAVVAQPDQDSDKSTKENIDDFLVKEKLLTELKLMSTVNEYLKG